MRAFGSLPDCYRLPAPMVTYGHLVKGINMEPVRRKIWNLVISAVHTGSTRSFFAWKKIWQRLATACHSMLLRRSALRCFDMFWRMAWVRQTERQWSILPLFCAPIFAVLPRKKTTKTNGARFWDFGEFTRWTSCRFRQAKRRTSCDKWVSLEKAFRRSIFGSHEKP